MNEIKKLFLIALLVCIAMMSAAFAGTTGKISGTITDAAKGEALISTNIVLMGTSLGATTDLDGNYTIVNIPPGIYSVTISMVGFRAVRVDNIKVNVDLTTKLDAQLQEESVQLETMVITDLEAVSRG